METDANKTATELTFRIFDRSAPQRLADAIRALGEISEALNLENDRDPRVNELLIKCGDKLRQADRLRDQGELAFAEALLLLRRPEHQATLEMNGSDTSDAWKNPS